MTGVMFDVTKRKPVEAERERLLAELAALNETLEQRVLERTEALGRSQVRFQQAFHAGPVAACITTLGTETFMEVNGAFLALTGYTEAEVLGKGASQLGMWSSPEDQRTLAATTDGATGFRNLELHITTKEGAVRNVLLSSEVIRLDGGHGQLRLFYDVTERKRSEEELYKAIQEVMSDTAWFSQQVMERLAHVRLGQPEAPSSVELTQRERQVLVQIAQGKSNDAIATDLGLAPQTVRNYISTLYNKLGVRSRAEAVVWARERGIS